MSKTREIVALLAAGIQGPSPTLQAQRALWAPGGFFWAPKGFLFGPRGGHLGAKGPSSLFAAEPRTQFRAAPGDIYKHVSITVFFVQVGPGLRFPVVKGQHQRSLGGLRGPLQTFALGLGLSQPCAPCQPVSRRPMPRRSNVHKKSGRPEAVGQKSNVRIKIELRLRSSGRSHQAQGPPGQKSNGREKSERSVRLRVAIKNIILFPPSGCTMQHLAVSLAAFPPNFALPHARLAPVAHIVFRASWPTLGAASSPVSEPPPKPTRLEPKPTLNPQTCVRAGFRERRRGRSIARV